MTITEINTPAKINIGLYVTEKRQDGYHNIETIFYPVALSDRILFEESDKFHFSTNLSSLPEDSTNLVINAKNLLEEYTGEKLNVKIYLEKNIPVGAGLGGGSSDAAAVLNTLNSYKGLNLSSKEIFDLALRLGSDVPFFLNPCPSFASGRGETLQNILLHLELPLVIVNPGINISTRWAYSHIKPQSPVFKLSDVKSLDHLKMYRESISNVFEKAVFEKYPVVRNLKSLQYKMGAVFSLMSGSGSTVFGIYPDSESAFTAADIMREKGYFVFIQEGGG